MSVVRSQHPGSIVSLRMLWWMASVARRAGAAVMTYYGQPSAVEDNGGRGPTTEADRASNRIIIDALRRWDPTVPIVSEESGIADYDTRRQWSRFWLVDPLDGTKEFLREEADFTVNIALVEGDRPVAGVVFAPVPDVMYFAGRNLGAWRQIGVEPAERLRSTPPASGQPLRVVESRSHRSGALDAFLACLPIAERVSVGSSLKFCRVAEGRADLYARLTPLMEWDAAAGDCVYRYSGARGERFSPLRYNSRDLRIPRFVIGDEGQFDQEGTR